MCWYISPLQKYYNYLERKQYIYEHSFQSIWCYEKKKKGLLISFLPTQNTVVQISLEGFCFDFATLDILPRGKKNNKPKLMQLKLYLQLVKNLSGKVSFTILSIIFLLSWFLICKQTWNCCKGTTAKINKSDIWSFNWFPETNCNHCTSEYGKIKLQDQPSLFNIHYAFIIMEAIVQARDTERNQYCSPLNNHKSFY